MYLYRTKVGAFSIVQRDDRWAVIFDDDDLGSYVNAEIHSRTRSHVSALDGFLDGVRHPGQGADQ